MKNENFLYEVVYLYYESEWTAIHRWKRFFIVFFLFPPFTFLSIYNKVRTQRLNNI